MQACNVELCEILRWCLIDVSTIIWRLQIARMKIISHLPVEVQYVARRCIAAKTPILFQMKLMNDNIAFAFAIAIYFSSCSVVIVIYRPARSVVDYSPPPLLRASSCPDQSHFAPGKAIFKKSNSS